MKASVWSATESAFLPGVVTTGKPRCDAASTSTFTGPPRAQHTRRSDSTASTSAVTGAPCTTSTSWPSRRSISWSGVPAYSRIRRARSLDGSSVRDWSSWTKSSSWSTASGCRPRRKTSTGTYESPTTRMRNLRLGRVGAHRVEVDRVSGSRFEDDLHQRLRIEVVEVDRLADPALHENAGAERLEVAPRSVRFLG